MLNYKKWIATVLVFSLLMVNFTYSYADNKVHLNFTNLGNERNDALCYAVKDESKVALSKYITSDNLVAEKVLDGVYHGIFKTENENAWVSLSENQLDLVNFLSDSEVKVNEDIYKIEVDLNKESLQLQGDRSGWIQIDYNPSSSWSFEDKETIYPQLDDDVWDETIGVIAIILSAACGGIPFAGIMIGVAGYILSEIDFYGYPPAATKIKRYTYTSGWLYRKSKLYCYAKWGSSYEYLGLETHYFTRDVGGQ